MTTYATCATTKCDAEYKAALGAGYAAGNFAGGACAALMECYMKCPCDASAAACEAACPTSLDPTCASAMLTLASCIPANCGVAPTCGEGTTTSTNTSTSTGTSCATVTACCTTLTASGGAAQYQALCANIATAGEANCAQILVGWQAAGVCK